MSDSENQGPKVRFWPVVGILLIADLILTLAYTALSSRLTGEAWSDALCLSAILLGAASMVPFFFDAGRGITLAGKMRGTGEERHAAFHEERRRRETGMTITFALALVAFIVGVISLLASLW